MSTACLRKEFSRAPNNGAQESLKSSNLGILLLPSLLFFMLLLVFTVIAMSWDCYLSLILGMVIYFYYQCCFISCVKLFVIIKHKHHCPVIILDHEYS